jgi:tripartite-type tricarboxylate transporter receptor subunit TctC
MKRLSLWLVLIVSSSFLSHSALGQSYPSKPIRMMVGFQPGGGVDMSARFIGKHLSDAMGQPVVIDNRPGAAGNIASTVTAKALADGYTLLMAQSTVAMPSLFKTLQFDVTRDLDPISLVAIGPTVLVVNRTAGISSVKELIAFAKAKPRQLSYGSGGIGNITHLEMELLAAMAGIEMTHVPYKGSAPGMIALIGGEIQMQFSSIPSTLPQIKADKVKALAVSTIRRSSALLDVPTVAESGLPGYDAATWYGILGPAGMAKSTQQMLSKEIMRIMRAPESKSRLEADGFEPVGNSPEEFTKFLRAEIRKWEKVIKVAGVVPE